MTAPQHALEEFGVDAAFLYVGGNPIGPIKPEGPAHSAGEIWRVVERAGGTTERAGTQRIVGYDTHLRCQVMDSRDEFLAYNMPGSASDGSAGSDGGNKRTPSVAREFFDETDMIRNVWYVYRVHDPVTKTKHYNAYVYPLMRPEPMEQSGNDNNEQAKQIDWKAILLEGQDDTDPPFFHIEDFDVATFDIADHVTYAS